MPLATKIIGLFAALEPQDLEALAPVTRRRFADLCRHWASLADGEPKTAETIMKEAAEVLGPRSGVLARLAQGERSH